MILLTRILVQLRVIYGAVTILNTVLLPGEAEGSLKAEVIKSSISFNDSKQPRLHGGIGH